jgi:hypothetical protein
MDKFPRPIRIVKVEERGLRKKIARSLARRMKRIPIDLRRAAIVRRGHERCIPAPGRPGGGKKERFPRDRPLDAAGEGNEVLFRTAAGGKGKARESGGSSHQLEKRATRNVAAFKLGGALRKFALEPLPEIRRIRELAKRAPISATAGGLRRMLENAFAHRISGDTRRN